MAKPLPNLEDQYRWAKETAQALRSGNLPAVDMEALVAELEATAARLKRDLARYFEAALEARLRLKYSTVNRDEARTKLGEAYGEIDSLLDACPSLRQEVTEEFIRKAYSWAKHVVEEYHGLSVPNECPFSREQLFAEIEGLEIAA